MYICEECKNYTQFIGTEYGTCYYNVEVAVDSNGTLIEDISSIQYDEYDNSEIREIRCLICNNYAEYVTEEEHNEFISKQRNIVKDIKFEF